MFHETVPVAVRIEGGNHLYGYNEGPARAPALGVALRGWPRTRLRGSVDGLGQPGVVVGLPAAKEEGFFDEAATFNAGHVHHEGDSVYDAAADNFPRQVAGLHRAAGEA